MSKLAVIVLTGFVITISVRCFADPLDESESQFSRKDDSDNSDSDADDLDRSGASAQAYASVSNRLRTGSYVTPSKIRLAECYACADCPKILPNTTSKYCPYTNDFNKNNKCIVYAEKYKQMEKPWYVRGCAAERGSCAEITRAHENADSRLVQLVSCFECDGDKCNTNGVYRSHPNLVSAFLIVIITPLLGKYTLS